MLTIGQQVQTGLVACGDGVVGHQGLQLIRSIGQACHGLCDGDTLPPGVEQIVTIATLGSVSSIAVGLNASV